VDLSRITGAPVMEFHVARSARDRYHFDESLFQFSGNVIFANFHAARVFAQKMNQKRDAPSAMSSRQLPCTVVNRPSKHTLKDQPLACRTARQPLKRC
jgi:hypothetical protein